MYVLSAPLELMPGRARQIEQMEAARQRAISSRFTLSPSRRAHDFEHPYNWCYDDEKVLPAQRCRRSPTQMELQQPILISETTPVFPPREIAHRAREIRNRFRETQCQREMNPPRLPLQVSVDPFNNRATAIGTEKQSGDAQTLTLAKVVQTVNEQCEIRPNDTSVPMEQNLITFIKGSLF